MADEKATTLKDLIKKGDGVLIKRNGVWTYPACANDPSGTNLVLPTEFVCDAEVTKALSEGDLRAAITSPTGTVSAVRLIDDETAVLSSGQAGSPEMGTELPAGSRVELDAGAGKTSAAEVEQQVTDSLNALKPSAPAAAPEAKPSKAKS